MSKKIEKLMKKVHEYLEKVDSEYQSEKGGDIYEDPKVIGHLNALAKELQKSSTFSRGFEAAVNAYSKFKNDDYKYFVLMYFVEDFYDSYTADKFYPEKDRDHDIIQFMLYSSKQIEQDGGICALLGTDIYTDLGE